MLLELNVKDVALIREARAEFGPGLNVLTGETGTGKSVVVDSALLALGGRIKGNIIREGVNEALIEMIFDVEDDEHRERLKSLGVAVDEDGLVIISRKISRGRNITRVNDETVTSSKLFKLGSVLIDIYGQQEFHTLMDTQKHLDILDEYLGESISDELTKVKSDWTAFKAASEALSAFNLDESARKKEMDMLFFQLGEIDAANIGEEEEEELSQSFRRLNNAKTILEDLAMAYGELEKAGIDKALGALEHALNYDESLKTIYDGTMDTQAVMQETMGSINEYVSRMEVDERKLSETEKRLDIIRSMKLKYGKTVDDINNFRDKAKIRLKELETYEEDKRKAAKTLTICSGELRKSCEALSVKRHEGAANLSASVTAELVDLGFNKARLSMEFKQKEPGPRGSDEAWFTASLNPGEPMKAINEVASGGELSRIMLALKTILARTDKIPTLIFDEIDTGISGRTAQKVAEKMDRIAINHQVICVTHLPQIAAMADNHFVISKEESEGRNVTLIKKLDEKGSIEELSRLLGGALVTDTVIKNAAEMRELAKKGKSSRRI